ncbi:MAG: excinuclease ABC subunit UvrA, partial [Candidatus Omnitrophica bacterium]|nr:excinuclease ABC subunit UvrA [Candidatus Omnitrophota bacterium]
MQTESIFIKNANEHNLKNVNLALPRNQFIVITGLSGSGKSSLAFDTIYAEGQRRYVESLSAYARQFLEQLQKPNVESISGLSPTISIEQKTISHNPRSTVATQTEIYDYLRVLFARVGTPYCHRCGKEITQQSNEEMVKQLMALPEGTSLIILAPFIRGKKGEYKDIQKQISKAGFIRMRIDGEIYEVTDTIKLDRYKIHHIEIVVDRLSLKPSIRQRLTDSLETALKIGQGIVMVNFNQKYPEKIFSENYSCIDCGINLTEIEPRIFSFNAPYGACPDCNGLGTKMEIDPEFLVEDPSKPWVNAIASWGKGRRNYLMYYRAVLREIAHLYDVDTTLPFRKLTPKFKKIIFEGSDDIIWDRQFEGLQKYLKRLFEETDSDWLKDEVSRYMSSLPCPTCHGNRLKKESLAIKINGLNIAQVCAMSIKKVKDYFRHLELNETQRHISEPVIKEIIRRIDFCINVGLEYLTLDRKSGTLSGGEAERIRLATQVGSGLVGVVYILDEPSIGLHQKDNERLLSTLQSLRNMGNTLIVVEHDEATIRAADYVVDLGPGAGEFGGQVMYAGDVPGLLKSSESLTGQYLRGEKRIPVPPQRRAMGGTKHLTIIGARENNLKDINVSIPLGVFACVTGVSGSGKSTLVNDILYKALAQKLYQARDKPGQFRQIKGIEHIDKVIEVDQTPIGRTPRSNPATYTGVFSLVRELYSRLPASKKRGFKPGRFSFNV